MSIFDPLFRALVFISLMSAPSIIADPKHTKGFNVSPASHWLMDYSVRVILLFSCGIAVEYFIGNDLYEILFIDYMLVLIAVLGTLHWVLIYLLILFNCFESRNFVVYRVGRNLCLAPIVSLFIFPPLVVWEIRSGLAPYESEFAMPAYAIVTALAVCCGLFESFFSKGAPSTFKQQGDY